MYFLQKSFRQIGKFNLDSLKFRLTFGIILILTLGLMGFAFSLINLHKELSDTTIREIIKCSILNNGLIIVIVSLFIWRSLLPLQQLEIDVINQDYYALKKVPTEVKVIGKQWNGILNKLIEIQEQQQQLLNNLSHELRTPLTMVYGYLQRTWRLNSNALTDSDRESLKMALEEAERMIEILQNLVALSRVENGLMIPLILNDLVTEVVEMSTQFKQRKFDLYIPSTPVTVKADAKQLMFLLNALLENACHYSKVDDPVTVRVIQSHGWGIIEVQDRGGGIPMAEQSRIFEPFYRLDDSRSRTTGGSGLGLSLVKKSVENMGGKIEVASSVGKGSIFKVILPSAGVRNDAQDSFSRR